MIDIIIPTYNSVKTIEKTLFSIMMQTIKDKINVIIVDDCSINKCDQIIEKFKKYLNIELVSLKTNNGPGNARNNGIKGSKGEYIIFLDSDDALYNQYSVEILYKAIKKNKYDLIVSSFIEELEVGDYLIHSNEKIWNHGKIYRRKFLIDNNILFSNTRTNEDLYFNFLIMYSKAKIGYLDDITYVWQKNNDSITRVNNKEYIYKELDNYNNNIFETSIEFEKRKYSKASIAEVLFFGVLQMYYIYIFHLDNNDTINMNKVLKASKKNIERYMKYDKYININNKNEMIREELKKFIYGKTDTYILPHVTIYDFMKEAVNYE